MRDSDKTSWSFSGTTQPKITDCNSTFVEITEAMLLAGSYTVLPYPSTGADSDVVSPSIIPISCETLYKKVTVNQTAIHADGVITDECIYEIIFLRKYNSNKLRDIFRY